jgi:Uma2 family endonuclease
MPLITAKRFTLTEYHRLIELGFLTEDDRVELIRGELIQMAAKGTPHSVCNGKLVRELDRVVGDQAVVRGQEPIILPSDSEPEPDVAIALGVADDYLAHHPYVADVLLVIEVSDSTLEYDRTTKLELYAEAGIEHYWVFNLLGEQLELHSQPYQEARGKFSYRVRQIMLRGERVRVPGIEAVLELDRVFPGDAGS